MSMDPQMDKVVTSMTTKQKAVAEACRRDGDRPWINFDDVTEAGQFEFAKIHQIFTRDASNNEYARLRQQKDTESKDIMTAKLSADFLAGCERDYRSRTRSRIRSFVHGSIVSAQGMGENTGPLRRNTVDWLSRIMAEVVPA